MRKPVQFCSQCGRKVVSRIPDGDNRSRYICGDCGAIHYQNPRIVAGCVATYQGSILLCKRAIEPRSGFWTVPAGFMELGESVAEAAARETWEEALAKVEPGVLSAVVDVIQAGQVHVFFEAAVPAPVFGVGAETLETRLFAPEEIPWGDIAFPSVRIALEHHLSSRETGDTGVRVDRAPAIRMA
jgi:ADP-ribose pyrophosphatase YjhB (NUDIX family)